MKTNRLKYAIVGAAFVLGGMATSGDTLDIKNLESYDESMGWGDVNLATAYVLVTGVPGQTTIRIR